MNLTYYMRTTFTFLIFMNVAVSAQQFTFPITVSDGTNSDILRVGVHPDGSDTFDAGLDTLAPPAAPPGAFDARLEGPDDEYIVDVRDNSVVQKTYVVKYAAENFSDTIVLRWDNNSLDTLGDFTITDDIDGAQFSLDMASTDSLDVSSSTLLASGLRILVTPQVAPNLISIDDITLDEGVNLNLVVLAADANGDQITLSTNNLPAFGNFTDIGNGTGTLVIEPGFEDAGSYPGIKIIATDDRSVPLSDTITFNLEVNNVNRAPTVNPINDQAMDEGTILILPIFANDPDDNTILLGASNLPSFGNLTDNGNGTGSIRFEPGFADGGVYPNIIINVTDDGGLSGNTSFTLTVIDTNSVPNAEPDTTITEEDTPIPIPVLANDSDPNGESLTVSSVTQPDNGAVVIDPGETTVTYTPALNYNGDDSFTYVASDGSGGLDSATVLISVTPINDAPTVTLPDTLLLQPGSSFSLNIWDAVNDPETEDDSLSYDFSASPDILHLDYNSASGILSIRAKDTIATNICDLTVTVDDSDGGMNVATISVIIDIPLSVKNQHDKLHPTEPTLMQNYPNPFNPVTQIRFSLPEAAHVKIEVYNSLGQSIAILANENKAAGAHSVYFKGRNYVSGTYYYQIQAKGFRNVKKMTLLR